MKWFTIWQLKQPLSVLEFHAYRRRYWYQIADPAFILTASTLVSSFIQQLENIPDYNQPQLMGRQPSEST